MLMTAVVSFLFASICTLHRRDLRIDMYVFAPKKRLERGPFCASLFLEVRLLPSTKGLFAAFTKYYKVRGSMFLGDCRILDESCVQYHSYLWLLVQALCLLADAETAAAAVQATSRAACIEAYLVDSGGLNTTGLEPKNSCSRQKLSISSDIEVCPSHLGMQVVANYRSGYIRPQSSPNRFIKTRLARF